MKRHIMIKNHSAMLFCSLLMLLASGTGNARSLFNGDFISNLGIWTQIASDCTPDDAGVKPVLTGSGVTLLATSTGTVTLRCNITNVMDARTPWNALEVVYRDSDGSGIADQVTASLHKVGLNAQSESRVFTSFNSIPFDPSLLAVFDSNKNPDVTTAIKSDHIRLFNQTFDFSENAYYVLLKVKRNDLSRSPAAFVVRLFAIGNIGG